VKLGVSNCERVVPHAYVIALHYSRNRNTVFDVAVRAWCQHNRGLPPDDAAHDVAAIIQKQPASAARLIAKVVHRKIEPAFISRRQS
jgi:hypothetical protein